MTTDALYERFERIDLPRHRKFYELEVELSLFYPKRLIRRWGKIGTRRARELRCVYPTPEALREAITQIWQRRRRHGYSRVLTGASGEAVPLSSRRRAFTLPGEADRSSLESLCPKESPDDARD